MDIERKLFYVTSPECNSAHSLARVNTIALGNPDNLDLYTSQKVNLHVLGHKRKLLVSQALSLPFLGTAFPLFIANDCKDRH